MDFGTFRSHTVDDAQSGPIGLTPAGLRGSENTGSSPHAVVRLGFGGLLEIAETAHERRSWKAIISLISIRFS